jgi:hypothetical protein
MMATPSALIRLTSADAREGDWGSSPAGSAAATGSLELATVAAVGSPPLVEVLVAGSPAAAAPGAVVSGLGVVSDGEADSVGLRVAVVVAELVAGVPPGDVVGGPVVTPAVLAEEVVRKSSENVSTRRLIRTRANNATAAPTRA